MQRFLLSFLVQSISDHASSICLVGGDPRTDLSVQSNACDVISAVSITDSMASTALSAFREEVVRRANEFGTIGDQLAIAADVRPKRFRAIFDGPLHERMRGGSRMKSLDSAPCSGQRTRQWEADQGKPEQHSVARGWSPCRNTQIESSVCGSFLSVVALVSVTLLDSNPRPSAEKRSNLAPTPTSSLARTTTIDLPECQERRGAKTI